MKTKRKPTTTARVLVRLDLDPTDHHRLRQAAAYANVPMSEFARQAVLNHISTAEKNKK
jgi:hypothetical protein